MVSTMIDIGAAIDEAARRFGVIEGQFLERDVAEARVIHVRRQRRGAAGGAEHANHEAGFVRRLGLDRVAGGACQPRAVQVQLIGEMFEVVVGLADAGGIEGIGFDQVGAGFEIGLVHTADDVRVGQCQQVVVALEVATAWMVVGVRAVMSADEAFAAERGFVQLMALAAWCPCRHR